MIFCTVILFLFEKYYFEEKQKPNYHLVAAQIILIILQQLKIRQRSNFCSKLNNFVFPLFEIEAHFNYLKLKIFVFDCLQIFEIGLKIKLLSKRLIIRKI